MEYYNQEPEQQIKKKKIYSLNLDLPKLIILSVGIIAILAGTFILGSQYFNKQSNQLAEESIPNIHSSQIAEPIVDQDVAVINPEVLKNNYNQLKNNVNVLDENSSTIKEKDEVATLENDIMKLEEKKIKQQSSTVKTNIKKIDTVEVVAHPTIKKENKKIEKKKSVSKNIPVVAMMPKTKKTKVLRKAPTKVVKTSPGFAIQVASYDNKAKATKELQKLKSVHYQTFINQCQVKEKDFYRVRIGPIKNKKDALKTLNKIQQNERYKNSYMIKQ